MHKTLHAWTNFLDVPMSKNCTQLWREAHLSVTIDKNTTIAKQFWEFRSGKIARRCGAKRICQPKCTKHHNRGAILEVSIRKNCTPLSRSAFVSQNAQSTTLSGHFLKFRCPKMARRCGAKRICKPKCAKHLRFAAF